MIEEIQCLIRMAELIEDKLKLESEPDIVKSLQSDLDKVQNAIAQKMYALPPNINIFPEPSNMEVSEDSRLNTEEFVLPNSPPVQIKTDNQKEEDDLALKFENFLQQKKIKGKVKRL